MRENLLLCLAWLMGYFFLVSGTIAQTPKEKIFSLVKEHFSLDDQAYSTLAVLREEVRDWKSSRKLKLSDRALLRRLVHRVRKRHFILYQQYSSLNALLDKGKYDCVSGTALYAILLSSLGYRYEIKETHFHVYLLIYTERGQVLLESTHPKGLVGNKTVIKQMVSYFENLHLAEQDGAPFTRDISLSQLAGLAHYNQGVNQFNNRSFRKAYSYLRKAQLLYSTEKISVLKSLAGRYSKQNINPSFVPGKSYTTPER